jgi:hypothetical protein
MPPSISEHSEACRLRQGIMGWEAPQLDGRDSNINPVRITPASTVCWPIKEQQWTTNISVRKGGKNWVVQETLIRATPMHLTMRLECTSNSKILRGSAITMAGVTNKFKKNDRLFLPTRQDVCQKQYTQCWNNEMASIRSGCACAYAWVLTTLLSIYYIFEKAFGCFLEFRLPSEGQGANYWGYRPIQMGSYINIKYTTGISWLSLSYAVCIHSYSYHIAAALALIGEL